MGAPGAGAPMKFLILCTVFVLDLSLRVNIDTRAQVYQIIFLRHWNQTFLIKRDVSLMLVCCICSHLYYYSHTFCICTCINSALHWHIHPHKQFCIYVQHTNFEGREDSHEAWCYVEKNLAILLRLYLCVHPSITGGQRKRFDLETHGHALWPLHACKICHFTALFTSLH